MNRRRLLKLFLAPVVAGACGVRLNSCVRQPTTWNVKVTWNVKDFGAVGDGQADDGLAIQATIAACLAAGGGVVSLPPGTYAHQISQPTWLPFRLTLRGFDPEP